MSKYGFDLDDLINKQRAMMDILEDDSRDFSNAQFYKAYDLVNMYSTLINVVKGVDVEDRLSSSEMLLAIKNGFDADSFCNVRNTMETISKMLAELCPSKKRRFDSFWPSVSDDMAVGIVADMIKCKFGSKHFNAYKSFFLECPNCIEFSQKYDSFMTTPLYGERYAVIKDSGDIRKVVSLGHVAGHVDASLISKNYDICAKSILSEVESIFYELLLYDFLVEKNILKSDVITSMMVDCDNLERAGLIMKLALDNTFSQIKDIKEFTALAYSLKLFNRLNSSGNKDLLRLILDVYNSGFGNIYSRLVALEFYYKYKNAGNPFSIIDQFDEFVNCVGVVPDMNLVSLVCSDPISFHELRNYKQYKEKVLSL